MTYNRSFFFSFLTCLLLAAQTAFSLEVPERPKGRVSDYAGLLSDKEVSALDTKLEQFEKETTNQIAVAIFKSLEGESLEDFSIRLAEKWKIGTRERDNGVILLIFLDDRELRIEVGYGLEGVLTDATASGIIRKDIVPRFREGDYYGGINTGIDKIIEATRREYTAEPIKNNGLENTKNILLGLFLVLFLIAIQVVFWVIVARLVIRLLRSLGRINDSNTMSSGGWNYGRGYSRTGGSYSSGSSAVGRSSGGSFSGGGGRFGGGGASGKW